MLVAGCGGETRVDEVPWKTVETVDSTHLRVTWMGSPCAEDSDVTVDETNGSVALTVSETAGGDRSCSAVGAIRHKVVELDASLGDRSITGCAKAACSLTAKP